MTRRVVLIINPASANGSTAGAWPGIVAEAQRLGMRVEERLTEAPGHATELARAASEDGADVVVAVGGDGTVHDVVNGLVGPGGTRIGTAALGVIARGTGRDFIRSHRIPTDTKGALRVIAKGPLQTIDIGELIAQGDRPEGRRFANAASAGVTGAIAKRANESSKRLGGTATFLLASFQGFRAWTNTEVHVELDGRPIDVTAACVVCAIGHSLGGGIKVAHGARTDDGLLEMVLVGNVSAKDLALNVHRLYTGTLGGHPEITHLKGVTVTVTSGTPLPIEADGELAGSTDATFRCLPGVLRLAVAAT